MGHDIRAFADQNQRIEITSLRLFPSEAFIEGNIYDVLEATEFRRSCCGSSGTAKYQLTTEGNYPIEPNRDTQKFLDELCSYMETARQLVYIRFS